MDWPLIRPTINNTTINGKKTNKQSDTKFRVDSVLIRDDKLEKYLKWL